MCICLCLYGIRRDENINLNNDIKERAWNNLNNDGAGFLFLTKRLRSLSQEQKDKSKYSSYSMHVPKLSQSFCISDTFK